MHHLTDLSKKKRFALILSNTYDSGGEQMLYCPPLEGRTGNVVRMSTALENVGFQVTQCVEDTEERFVLAIAHFIHDIKDMDEEVVTLFYFSGYADCDNKEAVSVIYGSTGATYALNEYYMKPVSEVPGCHFLMLDCVEPRSVCIEHGFKVPAFPKDTSFYAFCLSWRSATQLKYQKETVSPFTRFLADALGEYDHIEIERLCTLAHTELNRLDHVISFYCSTFSSLTHNFCFIHTNTQ